MNLYTGARGEPSLAASCSYVLIPSVSELLLFTQPALIVFVERLE